MNLKPNEPGNPLDSKALLAIVLCVGFYLIYSQYMASKYPRTPPQEQSQQLGQRGETPATVPSDPSTPPPDANRSTGTVASEQPETAIKPLAVDELTFETDTSRYVFSQQLGGLASVRLKNYRQSPEQDAPLVELLDGPLKIQGLTQKDLRGYIGLFSAIRDGRSITFRRQNGPWQISQTYTVPDTGYGISLKVSYRNTSSAAADLTTAILMNETASMATKSTGFLPGMPTERPMLIHASTTEGSNFEDLESYCTDDEQGPIVAEGAQELNYFGFDKHYFMQTLLPRSGAMDITIQKVGVPLGNSCTVSFLATQNQGSVSPGQQVDLEFGGFFGPKDIEVLRTFNPVLIESVNLGIFSFIARPLLAGIQISYDFVGNYGIAIILMTLALKILFYPLMKTTALSMHKMKKLNPQMQELREKYKDDRQKQQQELMKFMSVNKINPMKGCLPILPQIPVFFAFYQVLAHAIELRHADFGLWIHDLSAADPYYVTPVLWGLCMFVQQKLTPTTGMDKNQERIMQFLPLIFVVFMLTLPAGMMIYLLTNTVTSIAQQKWLNMKMERLDV